jgi:hypothetical protein
MGLCVFSLVVHQYERTIAELSSERDRVRVCSDLEVERLGRERDQALEDQQSVERSFSDVFK